MKKQLLIGAAATLLLILVVYLFAPEEGVLSLAVRWQKVTTMTRSSAVPATMRLAVSKRMTSASAATRSS